MKKTIFILSMAFAVLTAAAQVSVVSQIDSIEILVGQQATVTLNATVKKGQKLVFPDIRPSVNLVPGVEVVAVSQADTAGLDNGMISVSRMAVIENASLEYIPLE